MSQAEEDYGWGDTSDFINYREDIIESDNRGIPLWKKNDEWVPIDRLETDHLRNIKEYLKRTFRQYSDWPRLIKNELERRDREVQP